MHFDMYFPRPSYITYIQGVDRKICVHMGAYGCIWVHMNALGCRGMEKQANKASRCHIGPCSPGFGSYGRGNFPGHDVLWHLPKMKKNGCKWVTMGADGWDRVRHHGSDNKQGKKRPKWSSGACFGMHGQGQEIHNVDSKMIVACRESRTAKKGEQGLAFACLICLGNENTTKQTARQNKAPKQGRTNMSVQGHKLQKKIRSQKWQKTGRTPATITKGKRGTQAKTSKAAKTPKRNAQRQKNHRRR